MKTSYSLLDNIYRNLPATQNADMLLTFATVCAECESECWLLAVFLLSLIHNGTGGILVPNLGNSKSSKQNKTEYRCHASLLLMSDMMKKCLPS